MRNFKYKSKCGVCGREFKHSQPKTKTCSFGCKQEYLLKYSGRKATRNINLSTGTIGALAELKASAYLMDKGFDVFRALSPACFCDLVAIKDTIKFMVEVRTGYKSSYTGNVSFPKNYRKGADLFLIVDRNTGEIYIYDMNINPIEV